MRRQEKLFNITAIMGSWSLINSGRVEDWLTKAYGQLLGRDINPLAKLLLLRTSDPFMLSYLKLI